MRKNWKKLVSLVLTAACTMVVTVAPVFADAASTPAYSPVAASTVDSLLSSSVQWVGQSLMTYSDDDLANMEVSDQQFYARAAEAWEEAKADLGEVVSLEDGTLEVDGDFVTCTIPGEFEKNPGIVRVFWNISTGTPVPTDLTITVEESKGVLIGQACCACRSCCFRCCRCCFWCRSCFCCADNWSCACCGSFFYSYVIYISVYGNGVVFH